MQLPVRHPPTLWDRTAPPPPPTGPLDGELRVDVAIVGAGYTGLSAALHLAGRGIRAAVVEAGEIGAGASGRNNGQVIPTLSRADPDALVAAFGPETGERFVALIRDSASLVFDLVQRHGMAAEAVQNGWIQPAHRASRMKLAEKRVRQWGDRGAPVELLDREAVQRLTGSDGWVGGWSNSTGGRINPLGYTRGLAAAAIAAGAQVFTRSPAMAIARDGAAWRIVTPAGTLVADRVILATGTYSDGLWPGLARSVIPIRSYQMATAPLSSNLRATIVPGDQAVSDTRNDLYFYRYDDGGRIVTGGALMSPFGWRDRIRRRIGARVGRVFPQLGTPAFEDIWWGYVGITEDRLPHVHELAPGVLAWIGCNGRGVALATAIGREMAAVCAGLPLADSALPVTRLRPMAFHDMAARVAPAALAYYRSLDDRD